MFFVLAFLLLEEWGIDTYGLSENADQLPILVLMIFGASFNDYWLSLDL